MSINTKRYDKEKIIHNIPFFSNLNQEEKEKIKECMLIKEFKKGDLIQRGENDCLGLIMLISGEIRTYIMSEEGREITLFRLKRDDCCMLSNSCKIKEITFSTYMIAEKKCSLCIINSNLFDNLCNKNIYIKCFMYELLTKRFSTVMWVMQQILFNKFDKRLAQFLVNKSIETNSNNIKMTQEEISKDIGSAREVVARMLKQFENDEIIEMKRNNIFIKDIEKLKNI